MLKDLNTGKAGENKVIALLTDHNINAKLNDTDNKYYDLSFTLRRKKIKVEVKNDKMANVTGNIAIEIHNTRSDTPSGLSLTKAHIWAHILNEEVWFANTSSLKDYTESVELLKRVERGGDNNARLLIYPKESILQEVFLRVDNLSDSELAPALMDLLDEN